MSVETRTTHNEWTLYPEGSDATLRSNWNGIHKATATSHDYWTLYPERYYGDVSLRSKWNGVHRATLTTNQAFNCKFDWTNQDSLDQCPLPIKILALI